jgi:WD40 repeat protein/transcriptional regulator with XRE-family HTH domain
MDIFGSVLRGYRKKQNLSQESLAELVPCDNSRISRYETGAEIPPREIVDRLAGVLNLNGQEKLLFLSAYDPNRAKVYEDLGQAPDVSKFHGRQYETMLLTTGAAIDNCRLIGVLGMGGIGKTNLVTYATIKLKPQFEYVIWRSLKTAPPLDKLLGNLLDIFDPQNSTKVEDVHHAIMLVIDFFQRHRCLLVLDNLETILLSGESKGDYRDGYEVYGEFLKQVGQIKHTSCVIFTSREKPLDVSPLASSGSPVRNIYLEGIDWQQAKIILADKNLKGDAKDWETITRYYSGNPLALGLVAETIWDDYKGNIASFLHDGVLFFGKVNDLLTEQFKRLAKLEQEILYWLAIECEPVSLKTLSENFVFPASQRELMEARGALNRRSLVLLDNKGNLSLQNVIAEYLTDLLISKVCQEINLERVDLLNRIALAKSSSKEYVRHNQIRLFLQPIAKYLMAKARNEKILLSELIRFLDILREMYSGQPGYATGNLINLMTILKLDIQGLNFSGLAIWQAYLQNIELKNVNFGKCDFLYSTFADNFSAVLSVEFNSRKNLIAAGMTDRRIAIWQMPEGKLLFTNGDHGDWVYAICFSTHGEMLASGSYDHTIRLWDTNTGKCIKILRGHNSPLSSVMFASDDKIIIGSGETEIKFWEIDTGKCIYTIEMGVNLAWFFHLSGNEKYLIVGTETGSVQLWDVGTKKFVREFTDHTARVWCVAMNESTQMIASGGDDCSIRLWDVNTGECTKILTGHTQPVRSVIFTESDGSILCSASQDQTIKLWDTQSGICIRTLHEHTNIVRSLAFDKNSRTLISGSDDPSIRLWNIDTGQCVKILHGYTNRIGCIAFSPINKNLLACGYEDHAIRLWDIEKATCIKTLKGHTGLVVSIAFSPDGRILCSTGEDRTVRLWIIDDGMCIGTIRLDMWGRSLTFSTDGDLLCCGNEAAEIQIWDTATWEEKITLSGHTSWVRVIANHPEKRIIASGSDDFTVKLWDLDMGAILGTLTGHTACVRSVAFSSNGSFLASASDDCTIKLWDLSNFQCVRTMKGHTKPIWSIGFGDDQDNILASGSEDMSVRLWDTHSGREIQRINDHTAPIVAVAFSPSAPIFATGSEDDTIKIWDTTTAECLKTLRYQRLYEGMNLVGATGLTEHEKASLAKLGAIAEDSLKKE